MYKIDDLVLSVEGSLSIKGNFEEFQEECLEIMRETPLEITSDDDFTALSMLSKQFKRTEEGVLKGAIPLLDFAINQVKKGQEGLEKLEALRKELVSFNGKIEKSCKIWKDEEVERMLKEVWKENTFAWKDLPELLEIWNFQIYKNSLENLPDFKNVRSFEKKKEIAKKMHQEYFEEIKKKRKERNEIKLLIDSKGLQNQREFLLKKINIRASFEEAKNIIFEFQEELFKIEKEKEEALLLKIQKEEEAKNLKKDLEIKVEKKEEILIKKAPQKIEKSLMSVIFYFEEGINFSKVLREQGFKITSFEDGYKIEGGKNVR